MDRSMFNGMPDEKGLYFILIMAVAGMASVVGGIVVLIVWLVRHLQWVN